MGVFQWLHYPYWSLGSVAAGSDAKEYIDNYVTGHNSMPTLSVLVPGDDDGS